MNTSAAASQDRVEAAGTVNETLKLQITSQDVHFERPVRAPLDLLKPGTDATNAGPCIRMSHTG